MHRHSECYVYDSWLLRQGREGGGDGFWSPGRGGYLEGVLGWWVVGLGEIVQRIWSKGSNGQESELGCKKCSISRRRTRTWPEEPCGEEGARRSASTVVCL